jgi:single-strand DNA-binding protein
MISATVSGNIGRDAEQRKAGDADVVSFTIASSGYRNKEKVTDWVSVSYFGKRAVSVKEYLTKGSYVTVRGSLSVREYEKDGQRRFSIDVRADDVELGPKKGGSSGSTSSGGGGGDTSFDPSDPDF